MRLCVTMCGHVVQVERFGDRVADRLAKLEADMEAAVSNMSAVLVLFSEKPGDTGCDQVFEKLAKLAAEVDSADRSIKADAVKLERAAVASSSAGGTPVSHPPFLPPAAAIRRLVYAVARRRLLASCSGAVFASFGLQTVTFALTVNLLDPRP